MSLLGPASDTLPRKSKQQKQREDLKKSFKPHPASSAPSLNPLQRHLTSLFLMKSFKYISTFSWSLKFNCAREESGISSSIRPNSKHSCLTYPNTTKRTRKGQRPAGVHASACEELACTLAGSDARVWGEAPPPPSVPAKVLMRAEMTGRFVILKSRKSLKTNTD